MTTQERVKWKRKAYRWDTLVDICEGAAAAFVLLLICGFF
jgi:hypothetical protein